MKKIAILIAMICVYQTSFAGLFEYHETGCTYGMGHHDYWNGNCNNTHTNTFTNDLPSHWDTNSDQTIFTNELPSHWDTNRSQTIYTNDLPSHWNSNSQTTIYSNDYPSHWDSNSQSNTYINSLPNHWNSNSNSYLNNDSTYHYNSLDHFYRNS